MVWLESSQAPEASIRGPETMTDEELRVNSERTTENLMEVFEDPIFKTQGKEMELEEIDFWRGL